MSIIRLQGVSFRYSDHTPVLEDVELVLPAGWTGLVGPNGAGKTTLLRLIEGSLSPSTGTVRLEPDGARVATCPQEVLELTSDIEVFAWSWDKLARRLQGRLGLDADEIARWPTLSPGERKRWQIGAALFAEPDVLLLDEPTNHLDTAGRTWLLEALALHRGVGVVVSHDRALLDSLTVRTVRVELGEVTAYPVPYSQARAAWELELRERWDARQKAQDEARRKKRQLDQARREQASAERMRHKSHRMKDRNDSDARGMMAQLHADWAEDTLGRRKAVMRRKAEAAVEAIAKVEVAPVLGRSVFARFEPCPHPHLAFREAAPLMRGDRTIASAPTLAWGRADRIHLTGANGAGKSTLVEALLSSLRVPADRLLHVSQAPSLDAIDEALQWMRALPPAELGELMSIVAALGVEPSRLLASARPSPGEARKLLIARGFLRQVWGIVLDEPTNHLDLPSVERLEAALAAYPGALLLVTHDDAFAQACTETSWRVEAGEVIPGQAGPPTS